MACVAFGKSGANDTVFCLLFDPGSLDLNSSVVDPAAGDSAPSCVDA